jgi:hypothetical protein
MTCPVTPGGTVNRGPAGADSTLVKALAGRFGGSE